MPRISYVEPDGPAGGGVRQVVGVVEHVDYALLVDCPREPLTVREPVLAQDARPLSANFPL